MTTHRRIGAACALLALTAGGCVSRPALGPSAEATCWRSADRVLYESTHTGPADEGHWIALDPRPAAGRNGWYAAFLSDSPALHERGAWRPAPGDSALILWHNGLSGGELRLHRSASALTGTVETTTDELVEVAPDTLGVRTTAWTIRARPAPCAEFPALDPER